MEKIKCCSNSQERRKRSHKNYCPVSLLPIFGKKFEKLIFNSLFKYIDAYELLNPNQSGFCAFDSCVNQFISIKHEIFSNFEFDPPKDMHAVFLDISKVFDKIWLPGLIFKIKSFGISGDFFFFNWDSLHARLNSHYKAWSYKKKKRKNIKAYRKYL